MHIPRSAIVLEALDALGEATILQVAERLGLRPRLVQDALMFLADDGVLVVREEKGPSGPWKHVVYRRPDPVYLPEIGASEYSGWHPTGTPADRCKVTVLRGWGR